MCIQLHWIVIVILFTCPLLIDATAVALLSMIPDCGYDIDTLGAMLYPCPEFVIEIESISP